MKMLASTHSTRGFSLVEIMVAMVIGLVGILVMFQVFAVSEGYRRTTTGGGDAQQNGAIALYTMERELRQVGWGFNTATAVGCNVLAYANGAAMAAYPMAPVRITEGVATTDSDTVEVNYGSQFSMTAASIISTNMIASTDPYVVTNRYGFAVGDLILIAETGRACTMAQVTGLPAAPLSTTIDHDPSSPLSSYNHPAPAGSGVTYTTEAHVYNLGSAPSRNIYGVNGTTLSLVSLFAGGVQQTVSDGIVQMKAQYGKDNGINNATVVGLTTYAANDGIVDGFDNVAPATQAEWGQVLAVRIALVARSAQPEKPNTAGGACDATTVAPTWLGGTFDLTLAGVPADTTWQCYRYKVFQTTVPLRNMLWPQP